MQIALKRAGIDPKRALMIASPLPEDREAAQAAGVDWILAHELFSGRCEVGLKLASIGKIDPNRP